MAAPILTPQEMRRVEAAAINSGQVTEVELMERAAEALYAKLRERRGESLKSERGLLVAGRGNNGGDILALTRLLFQRGFSNFSVYLIPSAKRSPALLHQITLLEQLGQPVPGSFGDSADYRWIVDGIFGIGLSRSTSGPEAEAIRTINALGRYVLSADVPSGLSAAAGLPYGDTVHATDTVTFGYLKTGLVTGKAANYTGSLEVAGIGLSANPNLTFDKFLFRADEVSLPPRPPASHKGNFGHVYVWCGAERTQGASGMATIAALRTGSGLVTLWGEPAAVGALRPRLKLEVMTADYDPELFKQSGLVGLFGPGMGVGPRTGEVIVAALGSNWPLVLDGDALNWIAQNSVSARALLSRRTAVTVMTPHPKEASRLLDCTVDDIETDRYLSCRKIAERYACLAVLKGKGTIVGQSSPGPQWVITAGDTGLAKGGSGDTLAGIIASLLGQGGDPVKNVCLGVYLHGRAAELLSQRNGTARSSLATEISDVIPEVFKELECWSSK